MIITEMFCYRTRWFNPAIQHLAGDVFVFQQDNAPAHRVRATVEYLRQTTPEFISPDLWPPNSPDLNLVDYKIWGCVHERVYQKPIREVGQLKMSGRGVV